jgi:phosphatidylglycerophosphate synthase
MKYIPVSLIILRLVSGLLIVILALSRLTDAPPYITALIIFGILSDIFDGIIARSLKISTLFLRRLDSTADQVFWAMVIAGSYIISPAFYKQHYVFILILVTLECGCYIISYLKFRKEVATHAIASKVWTLILFSTLIEIIIRQQSGWLFTLCFYFGVVTRLEIIGMLLIIRQWTNDIPTLYHAFLLRHNKPIKRHKLFNG